MLYEVFEIGIEFRGAARNVHRWNVVPPKDVDNDFGCFTGHDLSAGRPSVHMAVATSLIAKFADVYL